ncbi:MULTISPECIES: methyltransferase [Marinobacter]|uniref:methyltransferase n=1 Tax=Marinobacter TaxID=2742 RepID=UPI003B4383A5|nr:methyltransferase [Marinobacter alkaliphilus]
MTLPPAASVHQSPVTFYNRWQAVNDWLARHQPLWRPIPFMEPAPAWTRDYPELAGWLEALDDHACEYLEENLAELSQNVARFVPDLAGYPDLIAVPALSTTEESRAAALAEVAAVDMPGRKREQAGAFSASVRPLTGPVLDWCCGKGHLARTLVGQGAPSVLGFEWNPELVADGNRLAQHYQDPVILRHQDVMAETLAWPGKVHGVALHACGDLHRQLIRRGSAEQASRLSFSPCCYHLTDHENYRLMSDQASQYTGAVTLDRNGLRLAVQETVTAPARVREQTWQISIWRLGFDALQRHLRSVDSYLPVPSHPGRLNAGDFRTFCAWAADKKRLELPENLDWQRWLAEGERRFHQVRRHELLRHLFRRPLELWLVFDYAVFLEEQGYRVRLGAFCERSLTPRNLLLDAVRVSD